MKNKLSYTHDKHLTKEYNGKNVDEIKKMKKLSDFDEATTWWGAILQFFLTIINSLVNFFR